MSTHIFNAHKAGSPIDFLTNYHWCNLPLFAYFTIGYAMKFQLPYHHIPSKCVYSCTIPATLVALLANNIHITCMEYFATFDISCQCCVCFAFLSFKITNNGED